MLSFQQFGIYSKVDCTNYGSMLLKREHTSEKEGTIKTKSGTRPLNLVQ